MGKINKMSENHYCAFLKIDKSQIVECSNMPVPLEECFPVNKVAQIAVRQHEVKLKQQKNLRKSLSTPKTVGIPQIKPMESINDPLIRISESLSVLQNLSEFLKSSLWSRSMIP